MPYLRNEFFTGRDTILAQLHDALGQTGTAALSQAQAIHGLGGVGKTQTAVEYAYRYFQHPSGYDWVLWVNASSLTLAGSFGAIATDLALPNHQENKLDENIAAVKRWLVTHKRWLLVFDNVDDPDAVQPFLSNAPHGRILITSRLPRLERLGVGRAIPLETLAPEDAHAFLKRRTQRDTPDAAEQQALETLAQELGYLPLALEQAAAYIQTKGVSFAAYLRSYQQRRLQVLEKEQPQLGHYPDTVATTWIINFEAVAANCPAAAKVLFLSAFLAPDNIPCEILRSVQVFFGPDLWNIFRLFWALARHRWIFRQKVTSEVLAAISDHIVEDELVIHDLLAELTRYSLIRLETDERYSIHRLVQEVLRDTLTPDQRQQWLGLAVITLRVTFPKPEFENWGQCARLVEHVQTVAQHTTNSVHPLVRLSAWFLAWLLNETGYFLNVQGRYKEAEPLYQQATEINSSFRGKQHRNTANDLSNLAGLYVAQGRYEEAEPLYKQALAIYQSLLGEQHPETAIGLNNLAGLYRDQGRYGEAEPLYQQALTINQSFLGEQHSRTADSLSNLAELYRAQGRYGKAEPLYQQALKIYRLLKGEQHPNTANVLNGLAGLYYSQERPKEAELLYRQVLATRRSLLGEQHPDTAISLNSLALVCQSQGHYAEAESLYQKALEIQRSLLGEQHPDTAISLHNLALLYCAQERYAESESLYYQTLKTQRSLLGEQHPNIAKNLNNLAFLYCTQGRYKEAEPLHRQALEICMQVLGESHSDTQKIWQNFVQFLQQVIAAGRTADLSEHPLTQDVLAQLQQG